MTTKTVYRIKWEHVHTLLTHTTEQMQRQFEAVPHTYEEAHSQRIRADALIEIALGYVSDLLPKDIQAQVKLLLEMEHAVWFRAIERPEA